MTAVVLFPGFWTSRRGTPDNRNNPHASPPLNPWSTSVCHSLVFVVFTQTSAVSALVSCTAYAGAMMPPLVPSNEAAVSPATAPACCHVTPLEVATPLSP